MLAHALVHTYELSIPIFMTIWLARFGVTEAMLGLVVALGYALFGLGSLPSGIISDRIGSRRLIQVCLLGMAGSFFILGVAGDLFVLAVALVLWGVAASVYHPSGLSLISKGVSERGRAFGYHGIAGNAGIALGPLVTSLLLVVLGWRVVAMILAVPALVGGLLVYRVDFDESAAVEADGGMDTGFFDGSRALLMSSFGLVFVVVLFSGLYYRGILTFLPDLLEGIPSLKAVELLGVVLEPGRYLYSGLLLVGILGQYVGGRLVEVIEVEKGIAVGYGLLALVAVAFVPAMASGTLFLVIISVLLGFFLFVVQPLYQATVAEHTPAGVRGLSYGYTYLGVFGVGALGAFVAGFMLTYSTPSSLFLVLSGFGVVASSLSVVLVLLDSG